MATIDTRSLSDHIYLRVREMLVKGEFEPGQKIEKRALAHQLGVSQTPINDALNRLAGEKYLEQRSRQGYFVRIYTAQDMKEMYEVRAGLEGIAVRLCIERSTDKLIDRLCRAFEGFELPISGRLLHSYIVADQNFHSAIIECAGNELIQNMDESFGYLMKSYQKGLARPPEETLPEHREILAAIRGRDGRHAQELMVAHQMRSAAIWYAKMLEESGSLVETERAN